MLSTKALFLGIGPQALQRPARQDEVLAESRRLIVKLQTTRREYVKVQKLRYDVFHREFRGKKFPFGLDRDKYEGYADHILVQDRPTGKIIGTYRLIASNDPECLYSASEFHINGFISRPGVKIELSRACIHKDFRNGLVLTMLWRGVAEYLLRNGASYLFGIPSIKTTDVYEAARIHHYFKMQGCLDEPAVVRPRSTHKLEGFAEALEQVAKESTSATDLPEVPPLFKSYLKAGARILGEPSIDRDFRCIDFFTVLHTDDLTGRYRRKYLE